MKKLMTNFLHWNANHRAVPLILFLLLTSNFITAQVKITGVVSDDKGMTIPGANISVVGSKNTASSDFDGKYSIDAPSNGTLLVSFIGFDSQKIAIAGKTKINISLKPSSEDLKEVVVIGYGTQKKKDVNGAISSVRSKDIENLKQVSIDQMLQGKAAGVSVTNNSGQPGGAASVRVRGTTSITGTNEPLYVIDGVPISGDATGKSTSGQTLAGKDGFSASGGSGNTAMSPLSMINPNDIESMDILKDASATAIYGSRGANGVIIITTKSGKKGGGKVSYENYTSFATVSNKLDVLNLSEYATLKTNLAKQWGFQTRQEFSHPELLGPGTNWQNEVYRTAISNSHQLSFSGAKDGTSYYLSGSYLDNEGTIINSGLKRYTVRLNLDSKIKSWLRVGGNLTGGITNERITVNQSYSGLISNTLLQSPDIPVRNVDGSFAGPPSSEQSVTYYNPVAEALTRDNKLVRKNFLGNVYAEADIFKGLKYRIEIAANTEFSENDDFRPSYAWGSQVNLLADLDVRRQNWYSTNIKNLLTYDRAFGKHKITLLAGQEANDSHWEGLIASAQGFKTNSIHTINLADVDNNTITQYKGSASLSSLFARIIYDFNDKYSITASIRQDVSSKFDPTTDNQKGVFNAISGSWKLSNESFMEGTRKYVDNIKFRVGYGETGNQQIPNNSYSAMLGTQNSGLGSGFLPSNYPNPNLVWESLNQTNLGIDFTLLNNKLSASFDVYDKKSKGFLFQVPLPLYLTGGGGQYGGVSAPYSNLGTMSNKGYDITVGYDLRSSGNFNWDASLVVSHYKNNLDEIANGIVLTQEVNTNGYQPVVVTNTTIGNPIGLFYGYKTDGIFKDQTVLDNAPIQFGQAVGTGAGETALGDVKYVDVNGDGKIDANDKTFIGNPHPKFTYGFTNNFKYKNVDLSIFLQGSYGNDVMNLTRRAGTTNASLYDNQLVEAMDYYSPTNTASNNPRPIADSSNNNLLISDRYVEDGSYLRIQNITLGYSLPQDVISKYKISRLRLYGSAQNLYTFTNYSGYDPEIGSFNQNVLLSGIDNGRYPVARTFLIGLNLEF
ncbi:MAG: TonB-dependent receptor [Flavobacterium nitrogenifigens]|uniref:TonB-linked outer membrane protein, SusC/RagA family n=1 Tax=Flavobacterium nitrogenifigens TaxID=1617283 RepID=A0A521DL37_9FLAO|nr:TonB-dependent receptor [Flavobacterium nitrogenifigens]KAF2330011.1 TonB-dependent receptor [Flavobacterium nitrogenifigens]MDQ8015121.1 TonB-dependent receptor [Flavobacterium nitrogenifigens]SMO72396.1 TonB-linked outer membrane protein, SusC/RagA family [Flavobacterium nitrogenifigens]